MTQPLVQLRTPGAPSDVRAAAASWTAIVAGAMLATVIAVMVFTSLREHRSNPLKVGDIAKLKAQLVNEPGNEQVKQRIREADVQVRQNFLEQRHRLERGGYLILGGAIVLLISLKLTQRWTQRPYLPGEENPAEREAKTAPLARVATVGFACAVGVSVGWLAISPKHRPVELLAKQAQSSPIPPPLEPITADMMAKNWPMFRGAGGVAHAQHAAYPTRWDGASGTNILWKSAVPLPGHNSPVVWEDRIFFCGATENQQELYCFDAGSGVILWKQPSGARLSAAPEVMGDTGFAPATMATDGRRVYAIFASGDVVAFDLDGKRLWLRNLGLPDNIYGHASSLIACDDRVVVQFDQGSVSDNKSALLALDGATGATLWRVNRPVGCAWSTPIRVNSSTGQQLVVAGEPWVIAYNPTDGAELWRAHVLDGVEVAPSPAFGGNRVFVCTDRSDLSAIATDGRGDVTATHVKWQYPDNMPDIVSPVANDQLLFMVTTGGTLSCIDVASGEQVWTEYLDGEFNASPILAGDRIYLTDASGTTWIIKAARSYELVAKCPLGQTVRATPAFVNGRIYIRGETDLFCIGQQ